MANDGWTELNLGSGGDFVDQSIISYGGAPTTRKRARVVIAGDALAGAVVDPLNAAPAGTEFALPTRNIPSGIQSVLYSGLTLRAFPPSPFEPALPVRNVFDPTSQDGFGRMRVAAPQTIFDSKQIADKQPLFWDDQLVSGSGGASTYNTNQASTTLSVAATTAAVRVRQTFRRFNYQPGKAQNILLTGILGSPAPGNIKRLGSFTDNNGVFFESGATDVSVVVRSFTSGAPADTAAAQSSWNLDKLDGTGPSGVTADWTKVQIFGIAYEWLGTGSVAFYVIIGGRTILAHQFSTANSGTLVYMSTPNLPIRYEIRNDGTGAADSIVHICATAISGGGIENTGLVRGINCDTTGQTTANDLLIYPVIALRLNSSYLGSAVKPIGGSVICTSTAAYMWYLLLNPTVTGTAFTFAQITNSPLDADLSHSNATTVSAGTILASGVALAASESSPLIFPDTDFHFGSKIAGTADVVVLAVQRLTGTTETFFASLTVRETT